jgi:RHS repeat-associated protein
LRKKPVPRSQDQLFPDRYPAYGDRLSVPSGTNTLQVRYLLGDQPDQYFARIVTGSGASWFLPDRQGSIRDITDASGAVQDHLAYDAFGNITTETNPAYGGSIKYEGMRLDSETGFYVTPFRYYDPHTGRWITHDPVGFLAGDSNLYRYVFNSSTNYTDPSGLRFEWQDLLLATPLQGTVAAWEIGNYGYQSWVRGPAADKKFAEAQAKKLEQRALEIMILDPQAPGYRADDVVGDITLGSSIQKQLDPTFGYRRATAEWQIRMLAEAAVQWDALVLGGGLIVGETQTGTVFFDRASNSYYNYTKGRLANAEEIGQLQARLARWEEAGTARLSKVVGGASTGQKSLAGLRDARNLTAARLQARNSTCGLHASASVIKDVNPGGGPINYSGVRASILGNNPRGLDTAELANFISKNVPDDVAVLIEKNVGEERLLEMLGRGRVISHVDGNHWVRVVGTFEEGGVTWVRVYDPARGNYDQLLTSFMTRTGPSNQMIWVRGGR